MADDRHAKSPKWLRWLNLCLAGITAATMFTDLWWGWLLVRQSRTGAYPHVVGRVVKSEIRTEQGKKVRYYADIEYAWNVAGHEFTGTTVRHGFFGTNHSDAQQVVAAYPLGKEIDVCYNPDNPSDAVLEPGIIGGDLLTIVFATPFNAITALLWVAAWPNWRFRETGGCRLTSTGGIEQLQTKDLWLPRYSALSAAIAAGLILTVALAAFNSGTISITSAVMILLGLAGVVMGAWVVTALFFPADKRALEIDWNNNRLTIPPLEERSEPLVLLFSEISEFSFERVPNLNSDDVPSVPVALITGSPDTNSAVPLGEPMSEWSACAIAGWLNRQIHKRRTNSNRGN